MSASSDLNLVQNTTELLGSAQSFSDACSRSDLKQLVYYYSITRYLVSVFEARNNKLPIQVWNEYRNCLDHYIRSLTQQDNVSEDKQVKSAISHMQRATLDIIKLLCVSEDDWFINLEKSKLYNLFCFVDNGEFLYKLNTKRATAQDLICKAKTLDFELGSNKDKEIITKYLEAFFAYEDVRKFYRSRSAVVTVHQANHHWRYFTNRLHILLISFVGKAIAYILILTIGIYQAEIRQWLSEILV